MSIQTPYILLMKHKQALDRDIRLWIIFSFLLKCVIDLFNWKKIKLFCLFVDYKKAFDMVWCDGLWYKLVKVKVQGKVLNVTRNMYNNIRSCVMLNQETSDTFVCNVGVRQGENHLCFLLCM